MFKIDGSKKSGSGTILRYSVTLASILSTPINIDNIRARRKNPGLRPQHQKALLSCAEITNGKVEGAYIGSSQITYTPGKSIKGGVYQWDIKTAGSTVMLAMTILPISAFAKELSIFRIKGGLFQDFAPSAFHFRDVLLFLLKQMGVNAQLKIIKPGYYPQGGGEIELCVEPIKNKLKPIILTEQGDIKKFCGISLSSHLDKKQVSQRMAKSARQYLSKSGYNATIECQSDNTSIQPGAVLTLYCHTVSGCILGADMAGKVGRSAETIGNEVARMLIEDISSGATVDRFTADQLILYCALADGESEYRIPYITEHIDTNCYLIKKFLGAKIELEDKRLKIKGIGFNR